MSCCADPFSSAGPQCIGTNQLVSALATLPASIDHSLTFSLVTSQRSVPPTRKTAHYTGGLWVGKFLETYTYQEVRDPKTSGELGRLCGRAARAEFFEGHAR